MPLFEDLPFRSYNDEMLSGSSGWGSTSQYSNGSNSYSSSSSSSGQGYFGGRPLMNNTRCPQNLPGLDKIDLGLTQAHNSRPSQMIRHHQQHSSTPYYCGSPTPSLEISCKSEQATYHPTMYNSTPRTPYTLSGSDYSSSMYDNYSYYPNGTSWPPSMQYQNSNGYLNSDAASVSSGGPGRRRRGNLPKHITDILRAWFHDHLDHPYPTDEDKQMLIGKTSLTQQQVSDSPLRQLRTCELANAYRSATGSSTLGAGSGLL